MTCHKLKNHNCPQIDDTCHILNKEPQGVSSTKPQPPCCHSLPRSFLPSRWVAQVDLRFTMRWSSGCGCVAGLMFIEATWYIYIYNLPTAYEGGRELIVTYIFGHMLPQKCNLHFLIYLDKCNLHSWCAIQDFFIWNLKIVSYSCEATSEIVTYIFEVCGCVALTLMPNNSQPIASIIQHTHKKYIIGPI